MPVKPFEAVQDRPTESAEYHRRNEDLRRRLGDAVTHPTRCAENRRLIDEVSEELLTLNRPLVRKAVRAWSAFGTPENKADLLAAATAALWEAFLRWNPDREDAAPFATFSWPHLRGAVMREVRVVEELPMSYGDFALRGQLRDARDTLSVGQAFPASPAQAAELVGCTATLAERALRNRNVSLETLSDTAYAHVVERLATEEAERREEHRRNQLALEALSDWVTETVSDAVDHPSDLLVALQRHGLALEREATLAELATVTGIGREVLRRRQDSCLRAWRDTAADDVAAATGGAVTGDLLADLTPAAFVL